MSSGSTPQEPAFDRDAELWRWVKLKEHVTAVTEEERALRAKLFAAFFPDPKVGTNICELPAGWKLKATRPEKREIDQALYTSLKATRVCDMPPDALEKLGVPPCPPETLVSAALLMNMDVLIRSKPELAGKQYSALTESQRAYFDRCLTISPGSITLTLVEPKAEAAPTVGFNGPESA